jgi:integrase
VFVAGGAPSGSSHLGESKRAGGNVSLVSPAECCVELEQIQLMLGHASIQTTERYLGTRQNLADAPNDRLGLEWKED